MRPETIPLLCIWESNNAHFNSIILIIRGFILYRNIWSILLHQAVVQDYHYLFRGHSRNKFHWQSVLGRVVTVKYGEVSGTVRTLLSKYFSRETKPVGREKPKYIGKLTNT